MGCSASIDERPAGGPGPFPSVTASAGFESVAKFDHTGLPNEDRCICEKVRKGVYLFTVIDGHKGTICSDFVRDHLHTHIKKQPGMEVLGGELRDPRQALVDGYLETDVAFLKCMDTLEKQVVMLDGVEIDITDDLRSSGACATSALIVGSELFVANAGDCRTLVCRSGLSLNLTVDQNCLRLDERQRVEAAGAFVLQNRVFGDLAVTRSFGDRGFKFTAAESQAVNHPDKDPASESDEADSLADLRSAAPGDLPHPKAAVETSPKEYINDPVAAKTPLTAKPEIETHTLKVADEFLILATDGLWNLMSNMEAVRFVHAYLSMPPTATLRAADYETVCTAAAAALVDEIAKRDRRHDDITAMVVRLQQHEVGKSILLVPKKL